MRSDEAAPWFSAQSALFTDWLPGDKGVYGNDEWGIVGGGAHGRSHHFICGYQVNTSGVFRGVALCSGPGPGGSFSNHIVSLSFNHHAGSYGGVLSIGCNRTGISYGYDGRWAGRVWLR